MVRGWWKTVVPNGIDRIQTGTFLDVRVRITAVHPYIRRTGLRSGHAAAINHTSYITTECSQSNGRPVGCRRALAA